MLLEQSPAKVMRAPATERPRASSMVKTSQRTWTGWAESVRALMTGTLAWRAISFRRSSPKVR